MSDDTTYWNGVPTPGDRGTAIVADAPEFPAYWARAEGIIGERIAVARVVHIGLNGYSTGVTYLDDRGGEGWAKVSEGQGSPRIGHRNVAIVADSFWAGS